jgi:hypothetical protein
MFWWFQYVYFDIFKIKERDMKICFLQQQVKDLQSKLDEVKMILEK